MPPNQRRPRTTPPPDRPWLRGLRGGVPSTPLPLMPPDQLAAALADPDVVELDPIGAQLVLGLAARQEKLQREHLEPFNADVRTAHAFLEERMGLPPGAIGTTHHLLAGAPPRLRRLPRPPPAESPPEPQVAPEPI